MLSHKGFYEEERLCNEINNKKFKELSNNMKTFLESIYGLGSIRKKDIIYCKKVDGFYKPDIAITVNGTTKYVSIKSGKAESIHSERIKTFILYLRALGISKETQKTILLYQYGDGTMDGTGKRRMTYDELRFLLKDRIKAANDELNRDKSFVQEFIKHCLFVGVIENPVPADSVYHGSVEYGVVATDKQILKHIERKSWSYYNNLHIGPILIRPHARYVNKKVTNEDRRHKVECYWPHLAEDIDYISKRY